MQIVLEKSVTSNDGLTFTYCYVATTSATCPSFRLYLRTGERLFCTVTSLKANDVRYIYIR